MPPCAHRVEPASSNALVTSRTLARELPCARSASRHFSAAVSPAMPLPTTTTSAVAVHPGGGASSRCGLTTPQSRRDSVPAQQAEVRQGVGGVVAGADDAVAGVDENDLRTQLARLGVGEGAVADEDDQVALVHEASRRAVDADDAAAPRTLDDVGLEPGAVVDVDDRHLLTGQQVGRLHQVCVNG